MKAFQVASQRTPIYRDAGFPFHDVAEAQSACHDKSSGKYVYSRYGNPNVSAVEAAFAEIEGAEWAVAASSGMAAIDIALSIAAEADIPQRWLFFSEIYGGTRQYIKEVLQRRRKIECDVIEKSSEEKYELDGYRQKLEEYRPSLVFFETISNPLLIVPEAAAVIRAAHAIKAKVIVDNTFGTPLLWKPLTAGADVVVHSATKYLAGHGNLTAGLIAGRNADLGTAAREYRKLTGCILSPDEAYRLETQMKTFHLRFGTQCSNAARLAAVLESDPKVSRVLYPGLESHPTHSQAKELFDERGFGAMVSFELRGGRTAVNQLVAGRRDSEKALSHGADMRTVAITGACKGETSPEGFG
jgi:cystathionine beta-lyase/cystathionine gamma-synthase